MCISAKNKSNVHISLKTFKKQFNTEHVATYNKL